MKWEENYEHTAQMRNGCGFFVGNPEEKRYLEDLVAIRKTLQ
jgi:hypothetical protein